MVAPPDALADALAAARASLQTGRFDDAGNRCLQILGHDPKCAAALVLLGRVLVETGAPQRALGCLTQAVSLRPETEAVDLLGRVLALQGGDRAAWMLHGNGLAELDRPAEALDSFRRALDLAPGDAEVLNNLGAVLMLLGRHDEALAPLDAAAPFNHTASWNAGLARLARGDFRRGWVGHEHRFAMGQQLNRRLPGPPWRGEADLAGRTLLLVAEQGLGDTLQFCRYAALAARRGARVILDVPPPLTRLLARLPEVERVIDQARDPVPAFDLHCPMMSLPLAFGTELDTIPAAVPYLVADPAGRARWRERLAGLPGRRIGLVWAGAARPGHRPAFLVDRRRSMPLSALAPLAGVPGVSWVSLQKGPAAAQAVPEGLALTDWTAELTDFADTADLVAELDLVISVDTSVAHLAGGLGVPVWILNRHDACWRWLLDRTDSPWYPTALLFRQPSPGDWTSVIDAVVEALT